MKVEKEKLEINMKTTKKGGSGITGKKWKELPYTRYGQDMDVHWREQRALTISKNTDLPRR